MESDIETATALTKTMEVSNNTALAKTFYTPLRQHSVLSGQNVFFLLEEILIYDAPESATSGGPDSLNRISTSISGTSAGIRLPHGPRASDEADGNTGRSQPGFSGSQAQNISYLPITGEKYFVPYRRWLGEGIGLGRGGF